MTQSFTSLRYDSEVSSRLKWRYKSSILRFVPLKDTAIKAIKLFGLTFTSSASFSLFEVATFLNALIRTHHVSSVLRQLHSKAIVVVLRYIFQSTSSPVWYLFLSDKCGTRWKLTSVYLDSFTFTFINLAPGCVLFPERPVLHKSVNYGFINILLVNRL